MPDDAVPGSERHHDKYQRLVDAARKLRGVAMAVAHPCDQASLESAVEAAKETGGSPSRHALHGSPCGPCAKEAAGWPYCRSRAYAALPPLPFDRIPTEEPDGAALWSSAPLPFREG